MKTNKNTQFIKYYTLAGEMNDECDNNPLRVRADQTLVWSNILVTRPKVNKDIYWILNYCQIIKDITVRALSIILLMIYSLGFWK